MPLSRRLRVLSALCVMMLVVFAPQLAGARSSSRTGQPRAGVIHRHRHNGHFHRHQHRHPHRKHRQHRHSTVTTTTTRPAVATTATTRPAPTTTTTTRPAATASTTSTSRPAVTSTTASTATTTSTTSTTTTTTRPVGVQHQALPTECLSRTPLERVTGAQSARFKPSLDSALAVDASTANWTQVDDWPVSVTGSAPLCWSGGRIMGTYGSGTTWETFHHTGGFSFNTPNSTIENVRVHNYGDSINVREGATNWKVRAAHTTMTHDDCLQDDYLTSGVISDSFFDGCYVGISTRPSSNNTSSDGRSETVTLTGSLLRLQPMPTVYKGPAPGHGGFFKWDDTGRSPKLSLVNNIFRVDQLPNHGSLGLPSGYQVSCSGNTIVWLGGGAFPDAASWLSKCPDTRIVTSISTWDDAAAWWEATH